MIPFTDEFRVLGFKKPTPVGNILFRKPLVFARKAFFPDPSSPQRRERGCNDG